MSRNLHQNQDKRTGFATLSLPTASRHIHQQKKDPRLGGLSLLCETIVYEEVFLPSLARKWGPTLRDESDSPVAKAVGDFVRLVGFL